MISETQKESNKKIVYIAIAAVVLIVIFIAGMQSGENKLDPLLNLGQKYLNDMEYEAAIAAFDQAISIEPKCEQAYLGKAKAQHALGQYEQAVETLTLGMEQVEDASELETLLWEIQNTISQNENDSSSLEEETGEVALEERKEAPFLLNYSEIVRYTNTENPTIQLEVIGNENKELNLTWTSSDENCVTVSSDGLVTCKGEVGYAYISVSDGKKNTGCQVRVMDPAYSQEKESEKVCFMITEEGEEKYFSVVLEEEEGDEKAGQIELVGSFTNYVYYSGDVEIPDHLTFNGIDFKINGIGDMAFYACEDLSTVTIPASIEIIQGGYNSDMNPFRDCIKLEEIKVDENNKFYKSEEGVLYSKDGKTLLAYPADKKEKSYTIPKEVELIYQGAFAGCKNLEEICIEEGNVRYTSVNGVLIDEEENKLLAYPCGKKDSVYQIPQGVENIGYKAFYGSEVKIVECSSEVTYIEEYAFASSKNLEEITGMENVSYITANLFRECPNLKKVEGGAGTTYIHIGMDNIWSGSGNKITILGMENMTNLEYLSVPTSAIPDITAISSLENLKSLEICEDKQKIDFETIGKLSNLEDLYMFEVNELRELTWVKDMNKLESLRIYVDKFSVTDLSPLFASSQLNYIDINRGVWDGSEIVLEENIVKQIEELKISKPDVSISIMED